MATVLLNSEDMTSKQWTAIKRLLIWPTVKKQIIFVAMFLLLNSPAQANECSATCSGSTDITVDLQKKCMCLKGEKCFRIDIGKNGPNMTTSGKGKIKDAQGAKYATKSGPGSTGYDNDALDMGIPENSKYGKWIHKTRRCSPGGRQATKGCIGVPCQHWPAVKKFKGSTIEVCGSSRVSKSSPSSSGSSGNSDTSK